MCLAGKGLLLGYIETVAQTGDPPYGFVNLKPPPLASKGRSSNSSGSKIMTDSGSTGSSNPGAGFMKGNVSVPETNSIGGSSSSFAEQSAALGAREPRESGVPGFPVKRRNGGRKSHVCVR